MAHEGNNMEAKDLLDLDKQNKIDKWVSRRIATKTIRKFLEKKERVRKYMGRVPRSYKVYIQSKHWEQRKKKYYKKFGRKCEVCYSVNHIQLHHKYYGNYGEESDEHLVALCMFHHSQLHEGLGIVTKDMVKKSDKLIKEMQEFHGQDKELYEQDKLLWEMSRGE